MQNNIDNLCRCCAKTIRGDGTAFTADVSLKILEFTGCNLNEIEIYQFPRICVECERKIKAMDKFKQQVQEAQKIMKSLYNPIKIESKESFLVTVGKEEEPDEPAKAKNLEALGVADKYSRKFRMAKQPDLQECQTKTRKVPDRTTSEKRGATTEAE
jgi:hypothetical protein